MAVAKKRTTKKVASKKRTVGLSKAKKAVSKRKRVGAKKGMLSELFSPATAKGAASAAISGFVGGGLAKTIDKLVPTTWGLGARVLVIGGASFVAAGVLSMPNVGAGMMGGLAYQIAEKKLLAENDDDFEEAQFTDEEVLSEMPEYLADNGEVLLQDNTGQLRYLSEMQPQYYAPYNQQY